MALPFKDRQTSLLGTEIRAAAAWGRGRLGEGLRGTQLTQAEGTSYRATCCEDSLNGTAELEVFIVT